MIQVIYKKDDLRYIFLQGDKKELKLLESYLNKIPSYQFMRGFKGIPRPEVFLNKFKSKNNNIIYYCHSGLWKTIYDWCKDNNIDIDGIDDYFKYTGLNISQEQFEEYVNNWKLNIQPRPYQIKAAWLILHYRQSLSQLATRAGKTLIAYIVFRYLMEQCEVKKILMIVPSIQLVKQGVEDFKEYKEFFQSEQIWAKSEYCECANLTIGTYQSLVQRVDKKSKRYDPGFFKDYDCILIDEAHHLICKSINNILNQDFIKNVKLKFGFTGTLPEEHTIESFCCHSLMGPTIQDLTTNELIGGGFLAEPIITQYRIKYDYNEELKDQYIKCGEYLCSDDKVENGKHVLLPKELREFTIKNEKILPTALKQIKKLYTKDEYIDYLVDLCKSKGANLLLLEQMLVHRSKKRMDLMDSIIDKIDKNCIIFAHHTEYLKYIEEHLKEKYPNKIIYKIDGATNLKKRQAILDQMLQNNNIILVASYNCCGTGLTFKNVDYCIFAQSFKSNIINLQSIGRMLLKTNEKSKAYVYDLVDKFPTQRLYLQGAAKIKIYKESKFKYEIINI